MAIRLHTLTPRGQTPLDVAREVAAFLAGARRSLELALYDVRLPDPAGAVVAGALREAAARGVSVRIAYNEDHGKDLPVPPPPRTRPDILAELPCELAAIPGTPDLMHHKYAVRDGEAVLTGSTNWTEDSWSLQENVMLTVDSSPLAASFGANFEELWRTRDVERTGRIEPEPVKGTGHTARLHARQGHRGRRRGLRGLVQPLPLWRTERRERPRGRRPRPCRQAGRLRRRGPGRLPGRLGARLRPARPPHRRAGHQLHDVGRVVGHRQELDVPRRDLPLPEQPLAHPVDQAAPVVTSDQHDREVEHLARLDQRERLEQLVERPEPTRQHHEAARVAHEHDLAREEVVEGQPELDVGVHALLEGQLDLEPDRERVPLERAAVGCLHRPRAAARDDREAGLPHPPGGLAREGVLGVALQRAGRAEDRHRGAHVRQSVEAHLQLLLDARDARAVGERREDAHLLGGDDLLVEGRRQARRGVRVGHAWLRA